MQMSRILIAEDEQRIAAFVEHGLRSIGFATEVVSTGPGALSAARVTLPVIILTARDSVTDKVAGLQGGADDYLAKPFAFEELLDRVQLRLRPQRMSEPQMLRAGDTTLDLATPRLHLGDRTVD